MKWVVILLKTRSEAREQAIKVLYQVEIYKEALLPYDVDQLIKEECDIQDDFVIELVKGVIDKNDDLVTCINHYLKDWTLDRLNKVDQAIFLLGAYELKYTKTPSIVAINEAIELSKKYSDEKVTDMLNGVLDNIYHSEVENE